MRLILIFLAATVVIIMTVIPAIVDGQRRFRWGEDKEVVELAERLKRFPMSIGSWQATSDSPIGETAEDMLRPFAAINRIYFNPSLQAKANVFILFGPTGPTAAHTPDICFSSRDFRMLENRRVVSVDEGPSKFFLVRFQSRDVTNVHLKSWYAWTTDGTWKCPSRPRFDFASSRYLFKIQIVANFSSRLEMEKDEIFNEFVAEIEKMLRNEIF